MGLALREHLGRALLVALALSSLAMKVPPPHTYGRVVLDNFSTRAGVPPAAFDHWRHRAKFTCRLCHVDVGFAMEERATKVSAATNRSGFHCGACHNGRTKHAGKPIFAACSDSRRLEDACRRCHVQEDEAKLLKEYEAFAARLPRRPLGGVDWESAEERRLVAPVDFLEGASVSRRRLQMEHDVAIASRGWMTDVKFSHKKHAVWNGCEVCHPEIFPSTKRGEVKYSMLEIDAGRYCGACHMKVAFHVAECERCHRERVQ